MVDPVEGLVIASDGADVVPPFEPTACVGAETFPRASLATTKYWQLPHPLIELSA